jgi:hypothetical protein
MHTSTDAMPPREGTNDWRDSASVISFEPGYSAAEHGAFGAPVVDWSGTPCAAAGAVARSVVISAAATTTATCFRHGRRAERRRSARVIPRYSAVALIRLRPSPLSYANQVRPGCASSVLATPSSPHLRQSG